MPESERARIQTSYSDELKILRILATCPKSLGEIADEMGMRFTDVRNLVSELEERGWVEDEHLYKIGSKLGRGKNKRVVISEKGRAVFNDIRDLELPEIDLKEIMYQKHIDDLIMELEDGSARAAEKLGEMRINKAVPQLIRSLESQNEVLRQRAAWALGEMEDKRAVDPLAKSLFDNFKVVRESAALALGKIKDPRSVKSLICVLDPYHGISGCARSSIERIGEPAVQPLIEALSDDNEMIRQGAALLLGRIGDQRAKEPLVRAIRDPSPFVQQVAHSALERIKTKANKR